MTTTISALSESVFGGLGVGAVLVIIAFLTITVLLTTGKLITSRMHKQALEDKDTRLARIIKDKDDQLDEWRKTHHSDAALAQEQTDQINLLLNASRTTTHLIQSMQQQLALGYEDENDFGYRYGDTGSRRVRQVDRDSGYQDQGLPSQPAPRSQDHGSHREFTDDQLHSFSPDREYEDGEPSLGERTRGRMAARAGERIIDQLTEIDRSEPREPSYETQGSHSDSEPGIDTESGGNPDEFG